MISLLRDWYRKTVILFLLCSSSSNSLLSSIKLFTTSCNRDETVVDEMGRCSFPLKFLLLPTKQLKIVSMPSMQ